MSNATGRPFKIEGINLGLFLAAIATLAVVANFFAGDRKSVV